jgi:hypothetical protein
MRTGGAPDPLLSQSYAYFLRVAAEGAIKRGGGFLKTATVRHFVSSLGASISSMELNMRKRWYIPPRNNCGNWISIKSIMI